MIKLQDLIKYFFKKVFFSFIVRYDSVDIGLNIKFQNR